MTTSLAPQTDLDPMRTPAAAAAHRIASGTAAPDGSGGAPALSVRDLVLEYPDGERGVLRALDEVSLDLHAGTFTALVGPSGSGRSRVLAAPAGLFPRPPGPLPWPAASSPGSPARSARGCGAGRSA